MALAYYPMRSGIRMQGPARFRVPLSITPRHRPQTILPYRTPGFLLYRREELTRAYQNRPDNGANIVYIRAPICEAYSFDARSRVGRETYRDVCRFQMLPDHATLRAIRPRERTERRSQWDERGLAYCYQNGRISTCIPRMHTSFRVSPGKDER